MTPEERKSADPPLVAEWPFPVAAALGSSVRAAGIEREIKARLAYPDRKHLTVEGGCIRLEFQNDQAGRMETAAGIVNRVLGGIGTLPVLPGEVEDILTIEPRERLKWTRDGRLQSAGTRTVKLRGRSRTVTFHVFDPRHVEDVLDRDLASIWREEDAQSAAEARRRAAGKAAITRARKNEVGPSNRSKDLVAAEPTSPDLREWAAFEAEGLLRPD